MMLENTGIAADVDESSFRPTSISSIIMESWEGSHVYKLGSTE